MPDKPEHIYFRVEPKIVRSGTEQKIRITPLYDHVRFKTAEHYRVVYTPLENRGRYDGFGDRHCPEFSIKEGAMEIIQRFEGEQEHNLSITSANGNDTSVYSFRFFSVDGDLFDRFPFKGDLHIHSNRSDGRESPGYVAASCRKIGLDFMALTDHGLYHPSVESQEAFADIDVDLMIYRGEEVHPPGNPVHIINFGGEQSVNDLFDDARYSKGIAELEAGLEDIPDSRDRTNFASSVWCFDRIREFGGLGIFCHPYWLTREHYHIPASFTDIMFEKRPFDAYEVIGGYHLNEVESNLLQVQRYQEERARGGKLPVVGVSDAHGCDRGELFGWYYTIVFAPTAALPDLTGSIRDEYSVAVEHLPGATPRAHGPFRLARYAQFLMREVFPEHDKICRAEGEAMMSYLADGDKDAYRPPRGASARYIESIFTPKA